MTPGDTAARAAVPDSRRGIVDLEGARLSRHLTARQAAEAATWAAWGALEQARAECWSHARRLLTPQQWAELAADEAAVTAAMAHVLECGKRLLEADGTIAADAQRVAR